MGKKGGWFYSVKKVLSYQSKEKKDQNSKRISSSENPTLEAEASSPPPLPLVKEDKVSETENDPNKNAEIVHTSTVTTVFEGKSKEEAAAIKIQAAIRGYLAKGALRGLRGRMRLKPLVEGKSVKRQAKNALRCMQTLSHVQSQIHARRIRLAQENQALQRYLQLKKDKETETMGETWDDSTQSKQQLEEKLQNRQEAASRRERALAYAYTHQSRKNLKNTNPGFMDPSNHQWGWNWLERWMAERPWEARGGSEKEVNEPGSFKSSQALSVAGEINRSTSLEGNSGDTNKTSSGAPKLNTRHRRHSISGSLNKGTKKLDNADQKKQQAKGSAKKSLSFHSSLGLPRRHSLGHNNMGT